MRKINVTPTVTATLFLVLLSNFAWADVAQQDSKLSDLVESIGSELGSSGLERSIHDLSFRVAKNNNGCELEVSEIGDELLTCDPIVLTMSKTNATRTVAAALASLRYNEVEGRWLEYLGEREAWVFDQGKAVKISSTSGKPVQSFARELWLSFASREIVAQVMSSSKQVGNLENRAPASLGAPGQENTGLEPGETATDVTTFSRDKEVRRLLEMK